MARDIQKWEKCFWKSRYSLVAQSFNGQNIDDEQLRELTEYLKGQRLPRLRKEIGAGALDPLVLQELNLGGNRIGDVGVQQLVAALLSDCVELRVLKLHKNRVAAAGAQAIAIFIENVAKPPWEVHLSHNFLGPPAARRLFIATARRKEYPLGGKTPLWLRLEWQQDTSLWTGFEVSEWKRWERMKEMVAFAESKLFAAREEQGLVGPPNTYLICQVLGNHRCCNPARCNYSRLDGTGPILHLPYIWQQGKEVGSSVMPPYSGGDGSASLHAETCSASSSCEAYRSTDVEKRFVSSRLLKKEPGVVFENDQFMVLNKGPYWLCTFNSMNSSKYVHGSDRKRMCDDRRSWQDIVNSNKPEHLDAYISRRYNDEMAKKWWEFNSEAHEGAGCVHRLDKNTSGCILRAKTYSAFEQLKKALQTHQITKRYLCLAHGKVPPGQEIAINDRIGVDRGCSNEAYIDAYNGEWAETKLRCLAHLNGPDDACYSLCEVEILTGRMHQIRVHMMHRNYPLVSDPKYNPMFVYKDTQWCARSFLHAHSLTWWDEGTRRRFLAPLADDLREALSHIRLIADFTDGQIYSMTGIPFTGGALASELRLSPEDSAGDSSTHPAADNADQQVISSSDVAIECIREPTNSPEPVPLEARISAVTEEQNEQADGFSPRAFQAISACVERFARINGVLADNRLTYTLSKLKKCGLVSLEALLETPQEQWPRNKQGQPILPVSFTEMLRNEADVYLCLCIKEGTPL